MKRDTVNNEFLKLVYDFYDYYKFPPEEKVVEVKKGEGLLGFLKTTTITEKDIAREELYSSLSKMHKSLKNDTPTFDRLWDFCEFIRVAEKIFFYYNSPENDLYVEADITNAGSGTRKFRISDTELGTELRFTLDKDVLGVNSIRIIIVRDYGLKMENSYTIADGQINYQDTSDLYLINEINFKLKKVMNNSFTQILRFIEPDYSKYEIPKEFDYYDAKL
jgi:hypothetical protein